MGCFSQANSFNGFLVFIFFFAFLFEFFLLAYVLDLVYTGKKMSLKEVDEAETLMMKTPKLNGEQLNTTEEKKLIAELGEFKAYAVELEKNYEMKFNSLVSRQTIPIAWWSSTGERYYSTLADLAIRVFTCLATSAAAERSFSAMGFLHSDLRNSLSTEKVNMLTYVKMNGWRLGDSDDLEHQSKVILEMDEDKEEMEVSTQLMTIDTKYMI